MSESVERVFYRNLSISLQYTTYKGGYPTWRKQEAGKHIMHFKPIYHAEHEKNGGHHKLNDRDHLQVSPVVLHFMLDFGFVRQKISWSENSQTRKCFCVTDFSLMTYVANGLRKIFETASEFRIRIYKCFLPLTTQDSKYLSYPFYITIIWIFSFSDASVKVKWKFVCRAFITYANPVQSTPCCQLFYKLPGGVGWGTH